MEHMKRGKNRLPEGIFYISLDVNLQNYAVQACKKGEEREEGKTGIHDF